MASDPADPADRMLLDESASPGHHGQPPASSGDEDESDAHAATDLMVVSRARRSNAGNRMSTLLAQSAEEEEWGEEWEEAANEEEFVGEEANDQQDFNLDSSSSSDSDDEGDDEDAGELELRRAEREERSKKRKTAANPFTARLAARKRVKVKAPGAEQPALLSRPKKKSERASWIPTTEDGPIRTSSRKQTIANKEHTLAKLKEKDRKRDDTLAMMKAAEARKAKDEPQELTQAERLAEAARLERVNSRSLHRWEEAEEQRAAERQAKIDAFKNRQIEGPFIRYYSGPGIWVDDKLKFTGKGHPTIEELEEKYNKDLSLVAGSQLTRPSDIEQPSMPEAAPPQAIDPTQTTQGQDQAQEKKTSPSNASQHPAQSTTVHALQPTQTQTQTSEGSSHDQPIGSHALPYPSSIMFAPPQSTNSFLFGIEHYAKEQQGTPAGNTSQPQPQSSSLQTSADHQTPSTQLLQNGFPQPPAHPDATTIPQNLFPQPYYQSPFSQPHPCLADPALSQTQPTDPQTLLQQFQCPPPAPAPAPPRRKVIRKALRNLLILSSFPNLDAPPTTSRARTTSSILKEKDKAALIQLSTTLFAWSPADATAFVTSMLNAPRTKKEKEGYGKVKKELCAVTNQIAKYRDPSTGIAYRDRKAFAVLRGVIGGAFVWSGALGCYVGGRVRQGAGAGAGVSGAGIKPAGGVPKRFVEVARAAKENVAPMPPAGEAETEKGVGAGATKGDGGDGDGDLKMEDVQAS